ncbi:PfkB family carbohydrate kinase [Halalkalibacter alkalisediminis]|uniref:PfkB family carbohydrate kinase n=1 Tax=Halalkalibacter alkalisediminis TaxID=935616 RepID=A0ABV6NEE6_9BACI|nr:PfkB family carbohydrate kinase [Halalkalibacter alkalisediminis]
MKLLAIGDNVVDYYKDKDMIYPGGNALNVAVLSKRYGAEISSYMGIIGNDLPASHVLESLEKEEIDISKLRQAFGENGMAVVTLDEEGDRIFLKGNKGGIQKYLTIRLTEEDYEYIKLHDLVHTSVYSYFEQTLPELSNYIDVSFDFSTQREKLYLDTVCPFIKQAFFSGNDLKPQECEALIDTVHDYGVEIVGVTRGSEGALFSKKGKRYRQSIVPIEVVDTLGAGDSFIAKFIVEHHKHGDMEVSLAEAAKAAADTCTIFGAFGYGLPFTKE